MALQLVSSLAAVSRETGGKLGGALIGKPVSHTLPEWPVQRLVAPLLGSITASIDETWWVDAPIVSGQGQGIFWRRCDHLIFGVIELDEGDFPASLNCSSLQAATREAYRRIFHLLDGEKLPHLWRIWNYMAAINLETQGLERYRQFNIGRQDAFLDDHRGATGNVPAACALGLASGRLNIAFLASDTPATPIENPRQVSAYNYPADYGPRSPIFSRAALAYLPDQEWLFISGTASIVGHQTVHPGDVGRQTHEAMANIFAVVDEANRCCRTTPFQRDELTYRVYIRRAQDFPQVREIMKSLTGAMDIVFLQADICRQDLLLEIEASTSHPLRG